MSKAVEKVLFCSVTLLKNVHTHTHKKKLYTQVNLYSHSKTNYNSVIELAIISLYLFIIGNDLLQYTQYSVNLNSTF